MSKFIIKRDGSHQPILFDKITKRNKSLTNPSNIYGNKKLDIDVIEISQKVISSLKSGMTTSELDELSCETAIHMSTYNPDYELFAARIAVNNLHKNTSSKFRDYLTILHNGGLNVPEDKKHSIINEEIYKFAMDNIDLLEQKINYNKDYSYGYFAFKTFEQQYLKKVKDFKTGKQVLIDRPQNVLMLVALQLYGPCTHNSNKYKSIPSSLKKLGYSKCFDSFSKPSKEWVLDSKTTIESEEWKFGLKDIVPKNTKGDINKVLQVYENLSNKFYTHASPTLFNSSMINPQLSSCFLLEMGDSIKSISTTNGRNMEISKNAGGIGNSLSRVRAKGSYIKGTQGTSDGIIPLIQMLNATAKYVNQGSRRKGAFAMYIEPWHLEIEDFLKLKLKGTIVERQATDLFYGLFINDIFMERVEKDQMFSLFCPSDVPYLVDLYGEDFTKAYIEAEEKKLYKKQVKAQYILELIITAQIEKGIPYMLYKDRINNRSNQRNIETIVASNLCAEIVQVHNENSTAVCNLSSISYPSFVEYKNDKPYFNFEKFGNIVEELVENNNNVIDRSMYPIDSGLINNLLYRPIAIGAQGLNELFMMMKYSWESKEAFELNKQIAEVRLFHAYKKSSELAQRDGSYSAFEGSPICYGLLPIDMANLDSKEKYQVTNIISKEKWDWLRTECKKGMRNSLMIAQMPTASTSQILGNTESTEPVNSNIYIRNTQAGHFPVISKYLYSDLLKIGLWNKNIVDKILEHNGSIQNINEIPDTIKQQYKRVWEIPQRVLLDMSIAEGYCIDQTQSHNVFYEQPTYSKLASYHMGSWKKGAKTGSYYIRSLAGAEPVKFTITNSIIKTNKDVKEDNYKVCDTCSG